MPDCQLSNRAKQRLPAHQGVVLVVVVAIMRLLFIIGTLILILSDLDLDLGLTANLGPRCIRMCGMHGCQLVACQWYAYLRLRITQTNVPSACINTSQFVAAAVCEMHSTLGTFWGLLSAQAFDVHLSSGSVTFTPFVRCSSLLQALSSTQF